MATASVQFDTSVSEDKILEAVDRIIRVAHPIRITAFGSRARGDFRPGSDLDLAIMIDHLPEGAKPPVTRSTLSGIAMAIDLLVFDKARHDRMSPWIGGVHYDIEREGVVLYERQTGHGSDRRVVARLIGR